MSVNQQSVYILALSAILALTSTGDIAAQQERSIEVVGRSEIAVMPDSVEITAKVQATGKTARKALTNYQEKKGEFNTEINSMKFSGVKVTYSGPSVGPSQAAANAMMMAMEVGEVDMDDESKFTVYEEVNVTLDGLQDMEEDEVSSFIAKITDAINKSGGIIGEVEANPFGIQTTGGSDVRYFVADPESTIAAGEEKAMASARKTAERLAKLAGGNVGKVISVKQSDPITDPSGQAESLMMQVYGVESDAPKEFSSNTYGQIRISYSLSVKFELTD